MPEAMSSSAFAYPSQRLDNDISRMQESHNGGLTHIQQPSSAAAADSNHLSPLSTPHPRSNSASPTFHHTPGSTLSVNYQSSDFSEFEEVDPFDPYNGIDFGNADGGTPSFLDEAPDSLPATFANGQPYHPLSPEQTPSLHTSSPQIAGSGLGAAPAAGPALEPFPSVDLVGPPKLIPDPFNDSQTAPHQLTPDTHSSGQSSEDGLTATAPAMPCQSPRVTVSMWGKDQSSTVQSISNAFDAEPQSPATVRGPGISQDDSFVDSASSGIPTARDEQGSWLPNASTGQGGLDPSSRPSGEVASANELAARRKIDERNQEVDEWLSGSQPQDGHDFSARQADSVSEGVSDREIPLGSETENIPNAGRTYYNEDGGGPMTKEDADIINQDRNWGDAPVLHQISMDRHQPQTSNAAIQKFERLCQDNDSIVSRAATWGTRRRSFPSILDIDIENITSGNFLKKLSISRGETRRPSILKELRGRLVRKPSANPLLQRTRSVLDEDAPSTPDSDERRDSKNTLAPPTRAMSWGKKQPVPSINTALVSMGSSVAAIGTTHARSGSISTTPPVTSPKSPFSLKVGTALRRQRSKSDIPNAKSSLADNSHPTLVNMWKKTGGPPVATLAKTTSMMDPDDDDDEDDEFEDADMKVESMKMLQDITPNFAGFQEHVLRLNPLLATNNTYLVDRIAHQQCIRYKSLLNSRVKHINHVQNRNCPCGAMCIALGGSANILDARGDTRGMDPMSARFDNSDGDTTPLEGAIAQESFPQDIPMPPTQTLPAEFECQLCYQAKKFQKPSDWTKHVHEDVQPFTCTWDKCRDPKIFKRKADWVRHENEGHRHLEWWTCDVEDCRHTNNRRDNFLQHLVREHKFLEPKVKTKAAIKTAGGADPTWLKVERCLAETQARPQDEPCRFCGKSIPTWKKLTVHLAKHMEQISLPVLRLVAQKELV